jgi:hypothetical protein
VTHEVVADSGKLVLIVAACVYAVLVIVFIVRTNRLP